MPPCRRGSVDQLADAVAIHHAEEIGHAQPVRRHHVVGPVPDLHLGAGGAEVAVRTEPGIELLLLAEPPDPGHALLTRAAERERLRVPEPSAQLAERAPPAVDESAVAPARAAPADVLLEQDDVQVRLRLLQEPRRPHPGVAAAQDHDVGGRCRGRATGRARLVSGERVVQPPAATGVRRDRGSAHGFHARATVAGSIEATMPRSNTSATRVAVDACRFSSSLLFPQEAV